MKKIVAFLLTLVLLLSIVPTQLVTVVEAASITNRKLTILKDKTSNIAPGVKLDTVTARKQYNKQQLVYYSMEIDLDPANQVEIRANYFNNDIPSVLGEKYGLQLVKDQMDAAAENHKDEENFTIVAGMNGTGYNMSTGDPHAHVLIMEGNVIQGAEGTTYRNFFGIRKNGEAMIGWDVATYNQVMASDNPLVEAVGGFSGVLIQNGTINPDCDWSKSATPDCNARTAIGVSQDGKKVVMLVVDGKQSPTSEGCDMYELAEILLDAGCYNAVNMDGGGSTTMVARPEGKENYEVISSPCDGAPRAVASSFYIVSRVPSSDEAHHAAVEADADYITPEGTVNITASALNYAGTAVEMPADAQWVEADNASLGTITGNAENAVFTSNGTQGETTLELRCQEGQKVLASVPVHVVVPTEFKFTQSTFALPYGKTIDITFNATYKVGTENDIDITKDVKLRREDMSMTISSEELGELVDYKFTAASEGVSNTTEGTVMAKLIDALGGTEITAKLLIGKETETVMDFEGDAETLSKQFISWVDTNNAPLNVQFEAKVVDSTTGKVHDGNQALAVTFDFTHVNSKFEGEGWFSNFVGFSGTKPTRSNVTGYGFWVWIPDEAKQVVFSPVLSVPDGNSSKNINYMANDSSFASGYDEGHWHYFEINKASIEPYVDGEVSVPYYPFWIYFQSSNDTVKPANLNNKVTFYIDSVQMDYSPITPDRGMPNIMSVNDGATGGEILCGQTYTYTSNDPVSFTATVVDDNGLNATGIKKVTAFVDGVPVEVTYDPNTNLATTTATKFAPGTHTLKFYAYDGAEGTPNYTNATRQFMIPEDPSIVTVKMTAKDGQGNAVGANSRIPIGSIVNIVFETTDISKIDGVSMDLDLNNNGTWYLDNATVNPKFTMTSKLDPVENIATITLTRNALYEDTDKNIDDPNVLISIPVRTWEIESSFTNKWNDATLTIDGLWSSGTFCRVQVEVDVDRGEITYAEDYDPGVLNAFGSAHLAVDTELFGKSADVLAASPADKTRWHEHTNLTTVATSEATCTKDGYEGQTYCEVCHSVVDWGKKTPATGHNYELNDETGLMQCTKCEDLYTGELNGATYVNGKAVEGWQEDGTYYVGGVKLGEGLHQTEDTVGGETVTRFHVFNNDGVCIDIERGYTGYYTKTTAEDGTESYTAVENLPQNVDLEKNAYYYVEEGVHYEGWLFFRADGVEVEEETPDTETDPPEVGEYDPNEGSPEDPNGGGLTDEEKQHENDIVSTVAYHVHSDGRIHSVRNEDTRKCVQMGNIIYHCNGCTETRESERLWWLGHDWDENHVCQRVGCGFQGIDIAKASVNIMGEHFIYTGGAIRAAVLVYYEGKSLLVRSDKNGIDGYVWYSDNVDVGVATLHIRGEGDFYGETSKTFEIVPASVGEVTLTQTAGDDVNSVKVRLDWTPALGATYYEVIRYDYVAKQWIHFTVDGGDTTTFTETLPVGTEYDYRVASRAKKGEDIFYSVKWSDSDLYGTIKHAWGEDVNRGEATCQEEGHYKHTCALCGYEETVTLPKLEHKVTEWKVTKEATTAAPGSREGVCELCHETIVEEIPQLPPVYVGTGNTTSPDAEQETVTNPDGSKTTTTTTKDGTVTETTEQTDGTVTERTTEKDGTSVETTTTPEGVVGTTGKDASGNVTNAEVTVPQGGSEGVVKAPVEVPSAGSTKDAPQINVHVQGEKSVKMEVPVTDFGPGTVAVLVHPDGTEEVVRDCVVGEDGVILNVEGDVTLKIVENSAEFKDIERVESWAGDAIEFTSARELFSGTGNNNFQPDGKMSRGALVTLLYRLSYEPDAPALKFGDVDESSIYADAVAWADSNSIVNGYGNGTFMPDNVITREQLVTLIYQYAQFKGVVKPNTGNINSFTDADKVSNYAKEAMAWAIGAGIVSGQGDNTLNPTGSTTRAQTAVILMKLCDYMAK